MDGPIPPKSSLPISQADCLIAKTHLGGLTHELEPLLRQLGIDTPLYIYPFRSFASTMRSFAEFVGHEGPVRSFLASPDRYFGLDRTVSECAQLHAALWRTKGAAFLNVDKLIREPEPSAFALARLLGEPLAELERRFPRRKGGSGKIAELWQRLTGRESTAVVVRKRIDWTSDQERSEVDARFRDLYSELVRCQIN